MYKIKNNQRKKLKEADKITPMEAVTAVEDEEIIEALKELPENQLVVYGQQKAQASSTATALTTKDTNPIDNSSRPYLKPINIPPPIIRPKDIQGQGLTPTQRDKVREAWSNRFETKKPLKTIEEEKKPKPDFEEFKQKLDNMTNKQLGNLLQKNNIKGESGKNFKISRNQVYDGKSYVSKDVLKKNLSIAYDNGYITL